MSKKFLLKVVLGLTIGCGIGAFVVWLLDPFVESSLTDTLFNALLGLFTFGAGAIVGLIGGADPSRR